MRNIYMTKEIFSDGRTEWSDYIEFDEAIILVAEKYLEAVDEYIANHNRDWKNWFDIQDAFIAVWGPINDEIIEIFEKDGESGEIREVPVGCYLEDVVSYYHKYYGRNKI